jgi:transcriptional regulator with GAF, ATPase, and Fis domain
MDGQAEGRDETLSRALSAIAQAIAASLELKDVFSRVGAACRVLLPYDGMATSLFQPGGRVRIHAVTGDPAAANLEDLEVDRSEYSPRTWPPGLSSPLLVGDIEAELDPTFFMDRDMIARGYRTMLRVPLQQADKPLGTLVFVSRQPRAFTPEHVRAVSPVAELVVLALEHERMAREGRERRRRRDAVERLLPALAGSLDVRAVFEQVARIAKDVVPHDYLSFGLFTRDRTAVRVYAKYGTDDDARELPELTIPEAARQSAGWDPLLARDCTVLPGNVLQMHLVQRAPDQPSTLTVQLDDVWMHAFTVLRVRSQLRVPVQLSGQPVGDLTFSSRLPDMYGEEDAEFGLRVAEHVALALAHQRLAEEAERGAEARERAAVQEARADRLARDLEALSPHRALGRSARWRDVLTQAGKVAPVETTVLVTGESGTGKEVVARLIHRASPRAEGPFVALNCAALPEQLLESELFGHEKGAFTGAAAARPGRIEQAAGGTLFLDEVGEMTTTVQAKFLRVLQERDFQRLGGTRPLKADVRVLAATNRDLKEAVGRGTFREDLFYRLAVFEIPLPPLRDRVEDIPLLAEAFLDEIGRTIGRPAAGLSEDALKSLRAHAWPGNVRELRNALERAAILCDGGLVTSEHLPTALGRSPASAVRAEPWDLPEEGIELDAVERDLLLKALTRAGNNKSQAARLLGLSRGQLYSRLEKHGLGGR